MPGRARRVQGKPLCTFVALETGSLPSGLSKRPQRRLGRRETQALLPPEPLSQRKWAAHGSQMQPLLCTRGDPPSQAPQDRARCCPAKQCCSSLAHRPASSCSPTEGPGGLGRCPCNQPEGGQQQLGILARKPEGQETSRAKKEEGEGEVGPSRSLPSFL